jgi:uncharacterized protein YbaR (Trm112 family)
MTLSFICPQCRAPLPLGGDDTARIECGACQATYPRVSGIPLLLTEPGAVLETWSTWLAQFDAEMDESIRHVALQLLEGTTGERTRARLHLVLDSLPDHRQRIVELFGAAGIAPARAVKGSTTHTANAAGSVLAYYTLIHRDWGWSPDVDEVTPAVEALVAVLPTDFRLGRTLVLGAGTARLAWQLGRRLNETSTILALLARGNAGAVRATGTSTTLLVRGRVTPPDAARATPTGPCLGVCRRARSARAPGVLRYRDHAVVRRPSAEGSQGAAAHDPLAPP